MPRNVYGATKTAAEDLCKLVHRDHGLPCLILRTSRFFPRRTTTTTSATRTTTSTSRSTSCCTAASTSPTSSARALRARARAAIGFGRYIVSATTPSAGDLADCAPTRRGRAPPRAGFEDDFAREAGDVPEINHVYDNDRARRDLGWRPGYDFPAALERWRPARTGAESALARSSRSKGYHAVSTGPYTVR